MPCKIFFTWAHKGQCQDWQVSSGWQGASEINILVGTATILASLRNNVIICGCFQHPCGITKQMEMERNFTNVNVLKPTEMTYFLCLIQFLFSVKILTMKVASCYLQKWHIKFRGVLLWNPCKNYLKGVFNCRRSWNIVNVIVHTQVEYWVYTRKNLREGCRRVLVVVEVPRFSPLTIH